MTGLSHQAAHDVLCVAQAKIAHSYVPHGYARFGNSCTDITDSRFRHLHGTLYSFRLLAEKFSCLSEGVVEGGNGRGGEELFVAG